MQRLERPCARRRRLKHPHSRVLLMTEPASIDGNELTDKGYINQRATRERRAHLVERLHAGNPDADVIIVPT